MSQIVGFSEGLVESLRRLAAEIEAALGTARAEADAASVEMYERAMEAEGISKYQREHIHDAVTQRESRAKGYCVRARAAAEAIIIEVLTRGSCESDDDLEAIAAMFAGPIRLAVGEEREACARVMDGIAEETHRHLGNMFGIAHHTATRGAAAIRVRGGA